MPLSDENQCRQCGHIKMPLKTVKARRASIRNCCGKKGFCRENKGIEKGDASDERELFEDEHLTKPTEPNIFSSDEIVLCENIVENKWKEIMMTDGFLETGQIAIISQMAHQNTQTATKGRRH